MAPYQNLENLINYKIPIKINSFHKSQIINYCLFLHYASDLLDGAMMSAETQVGE